MIRTGIFTIIVLGLLSCQKNNDNKRNEYNTKITNNSTEIIGAEFVITDSLDVNIIGKDVQLIDFSDNKRLYLVSSFYRNDTLFLIDSLGKLVRKFKVTGEEPDKIGMLCANVAFFNDSLIFTSGSRGYNIYDTDFKLIDKANSPNKEPLLDNRKVRFYKNHAISFDRLNISYNQLFAYKNDTKKIAANTKLLSDWDLKLKKHSFVINHPANSKWITDNFCYSSLKKFFDMDMEGNLYVLIDPDFKIYRFNIENNFELEEEIVINLENYKRSFSIEIESMDKNFPKEQIVNSHIKNFYYADSLFYIIYDTAVEESEYDRTTTDVDALKLYEGKRNYLTIYNRNGQKLINDFLLPANIDNISFVKSKNQIYFKSNNYFEDLFASRFYIGSINNKD